MSKESREARGHCPWQKHAAAYVDGTLSEKKMAQMRAHLDTGCAVCASAVEHEERLRMIYAVAVPAPNAAQMQAMEDRVMAAVRGDAIAASLKTENARGASRMRTWKTVCGVAIALVLVIGLVRFMPDLLVTADNASKEALIGDFNGGAMLDAEAEDIKNASGGGEKPEAADKHDTVKDESANGMLADQTTPSFSYSSSDVLTPPYEVEEDAAEPEGVTTQAATTSAATTPECETEASESAAGSDDQVCTCTLVIGADDAEEAAKILQQLARKFGETVTEVTSGRVVSASLYRDLCAELDTAGIAYRATVTETAKDDTQNGRLFLLWTP